MQKNKLLSLKVHNRDEIVFDDTVISLSSYNDMGKFDVLGEHANFISLVKDKMEIKLKDGKIREIAIKDGVMKVEGNKIDVFMGVNF